MSLEAWRPEFLPAWTRYWNRVFADRRNYFPVTGDVLSERILDHPAFEPERMVVSVEGDEVTGMVHVGTKEDGKRGVVMFLHVDPAHRRRGLGTALWHAGRERLEGAETVFVDGSFENPIYGKGDGPRTPLWGTPHGVAVDWEDSATQKFLAQKGHAPKVRAVHLALDLAEAAPSPSVDEEARAAGVTLEASSLRHPELGGPAGEGRTIRGSFLSVAAVADGRVAGLLSTYPMREAGAGLHGVHEACVDGEFADRGLGKILLDAMIARLGASGATSIEALAIPEVDPAGEKVYASAGFIRIASWAVY